MPGSGAGLFPSIHLEAQTLASKRSKSDTPVLTLTLTGLEVSILRAAVHDHILSLESNRRRAGRGQIISIEQEDTEAARAFELAHRNIGARIDKARAFSKRVR